MIQIALYRQDVMDCEKITPLPLVNLGNSCFVNVALQLLELLLTEEKNSEKLCSDVTIPWLCRKTDSKYRHALLKKFIDTQHEKIVLGKQGDPVEFFLHLLSGMKLANRFVSFPVQANKQVMTLESVIFRSGQTHMWRDFTLLTLNPYSNTDPDIRMHYIQPHEEHYILENKRIVKLIGIVMHDIENNNMHSFCYLKHRDDWYLCNDEIVEEIKFEDIDQQELIAKSYGYLLDCRIENGL